MAEQESLDYKQSKEASKDYIVPEEFQRKVYELLDGANKQMIDYCQDCCYQMQEDLRKKDDPEMSTEGMPE